MESGPEALLGKLAVERGLITDKQLRMCLRERRRHNGHGPALGVILLSKGLIRKRDLVGLLEEQKRRIQTLDTCHKTQKAELLFGQILVTEDKATQNQINKCLEIQEQRALEGAELVPCLGELLLLYGFVSQDAVAGALKKQNKQALVCTGCGRQSSAPAENENDTYRCRHCGGTMVTRSRLDASGDPGAPLHLAPPLEER